MFRRPIISRIITSYKLPHVKSMSSGAEIKTRFKKLIPKILGYGVAVIGCIAYAYARIVYVQPHLDERKRIKIAERNARIAEEEAIEAAEEAEKEAKTKNITEAIIPKQSK